MRGRIREGTACYHSLLRSIILAVDASKQTFKEILAIDMTAFRGEESRVDLHTHKRIRADITTRIYTDSPCREYHTQS